MTLSIVRECLKQTTKGFKSNNKQTITCSYFAKSKSIFVAWLLFRISSNVLETQKKALATDKPSSTLPVRSPRSGAHFRKSSIALVSYRRWLLAIPHPRRQQTERQPRIMKCMKAISYQYMFEG